jgi:hypothetical protein
VQIPEPGRIPGIEPCQDARPHRRRPPQCPGRIERCSLSNKSRRDPGADPETAAQSSSSAFAAACAEPSACMRREMRTPPAMACGEARSSMCARSDRHFLYTRIPAILYLASKHCQIMDVTSSYAAASRSGFAGDRNEHSTADAQARSRRRGRLHLPRATLSHIRVPSHLWSSRHRSPRSARRGAFVCGTPRRTRPSRRASGPVWRSAAPREQTESAQGTAGSDRPPRRPAQGGDGVQVDRGRRMDGTVQLTMSERPVANGGPWAPVTSILITITNTFLSFPTDLMKSWPTGRLRVLEWPLVSVNGAMASACLGFGIARLAGREVARPWSNEWTGMG